MRGEPQKYIKPSFGSFEQVSADTNQSYLMCLHTCSGGFAPYRSNRQARIGILRGQF